jgi:hypothetical protein
LSSRTTTANLPRRWRATTSPRRAGDAPRQEAHAPTVVNT